MRSFKDKNGSEWPVDVDLAVITRVKSACGINIVDLVLGKIDESLRDDLEKIGQLLWAINEVEAKNRTIRPENFAALCNGDAIDDAWRAMSLAVADFLSQSRRTLAMKIIDKGDQVAKAAIAAATENVDKIDPSAVVTKLLGGSANSAASPA